MTAVFHFEGRLVQVSSSNGLAVGDNFSGSFSYLLDQVGEPIELIVPGERSRYALGSYSVTLGGETIASTGGIIDISNDIVPYGNLPSVVWDRLDLDPGPDAGAVVSGSLNGCPASDLLFSLVNTSGQPFSDTSLPADLVLRDFPASPQMQVIFANGGGGIIGDITALQLVPEPGEGPLIIVAGMVVLVGPNWRAQFGFGKRRKTSV